MTKKELELIVTIAMKSDISDNTKYELKDVLENASDYIHLINSNDNRFVTYPFYWTREDIDESLDKPLTDAEFNELSCRLNRLDSIDSETINYVIYDMRNN